MLAGTVAVTGRRPDGQPVSSLRINSAVLTLEALPSDLRGIVSRFRPFAGMPHGPIGGSHGQRGVGSCRALAEAFLSETKCVCLLSTFRPNARTY
jgi:hypothetical protein